MIVTYIFFWIRSGIHQQLSSASQLSLAQLEERKTVTVQRAIVILRPAVRSREGRRFFCRSDILYRWGIVGVDGISQNPTFLARKRMLEHFDAVVKVHDLPSCHTQLDLMYTMYEYRGDKAR